MEKKSSTAPIKTSTSVMPATTKAPTAVVPTAKAPTAVMPVAEAPAKPMEHHEKKNWCKEHMHRYVLIQTHDGYYADGFVEHIDDEMVCIAVPHCGSHSNRAFLPYPYPYPAYYPYPFYPRGRFVRQAFPLVALAGLTLLPFY